MGSVTFNDSYYVSGIGSSEQNVKINFSESYNASTNKTTVTFSSCQIASSLFLGNCVVRGKVQFNGSDVKTYPTSTSSYTASISGGTSNYATVTGGSGSSITVTHNTSGKASFTIKLVALEGSYFGAAYRGKMFGVAGGSSKSVSLTTHTSALLVNPNGGTWNGSTSSQSFTQAPTSTKTIENPTRTGYTFTGWTLTGGGSFSGTTYTYGSSNGALTASWILDTYSVIYDANGHGTAPSSQTKTYGESLTLQSFISNQQETGTASNYTVTGNANGGYWTGSNGSATRTPTITYTQTEWNTNSSGTGTSYSSGASYTTNAALSLYAIWSSSTTYNYTYSLPTGTPTNTEIITVTFNPNGGTTTKPSAEAGRVMSFDGWWTEPTGGTKRTTSSQISSDETVYAHYSSGSGLFTSVTLPTAAQCTRSGFELLGWSTSSSATVAQYQPGAAYNTSASGIVYAVWKAAGSVHIDNGTTFDLYCIYIDNGVSWDQYLPYIDNGTSWDIYS